MLLVLDVSSPQWDDKHRCFTDRLHSTYDARFRGPTLFHQDTLWTGPFSGLRVFDGCLTGVGVCVSVLGFFNIFTQGLNFHHTEHSHAPEEKQQSFLVTYSCCVRCISSQAPMEHCV